ncbi:AAA family ATPase [Lactococcus lactis]|uniref:AAA family ATPase n=1 Tax=Lactococcus lactis TaxID=1358 RepID=UPI003D2D1895
MEFKNIGPIKQGSINLSDMTIFFGKNGTGKTYISYVIFGVLSFLSENSLKFFTDEEIQDLISNNKIVLDYNEITERAKHTVLQNVNSNMSNILKKSFNRSDKEISKFEVIFTDEDFEQLQYFRSKEETDRYFEFRSYSQYVIKGIKGISEEKVYNTIINFEENKGKIGISLVENNSKKDVYNENFIEPISTIQGKEELLVRLNELLSSSLRNSRNIVYIPAERIGINVFLKEINKNRLNAYDKIIENSRDSGYINDKLDVYPSPISSYLSNLNRWKEFYELFFDKDYSLASPELEDTKAILTSKLLKGKFTIDSEKDEIKYISNNTQDELPLQISSSSIKSLVGLELYLQTTARVGDYLIIDEPELNLHPESQKNLAIVLNGLVKIGFKVIISTHSDYLIRELVNIELEKQIDAKMNSSKFSSNILSYDFIDSSVNQIPNLLKEQTIGNFDKVTDDIEDRYYDLIDRYQELLEEKKNDF